jgi:hypothetical protein
MADTESKVVEIDTFKKAKLIDLLCKAHGMATDASLFEDVSYAEQLEMEADYLLSHGVTVQIKKEKPPTDLAGKCGGCAYAEVVHDVFGGSYCYVKCINPEHIAKYCSRRASPIRQRTVKACKLYKSRTEPTAKGID